MSEDDCSSGCGEPSACVCVGPAVFCLPQGDRSFCCSKKSNARMDLAVKDDGEFIIADKEVRR